MSLKKHVIQKLLLENKLKEYDVINCEMISFHVKYGTNIIRHNEIPTLTTKCDFLVVLGDEYE